MCRLILSVLCIRVETIHFKPKCKSPPPTWPVLRRSAQHLLTGGGADVLWQRGEIISSNRETSASDQCIEKQFRILIYILDWCIGESTFDDVFSSHIAAEHLGRLTNTEMRIEEEIILLLGKLSLAFRMYGKTRYLWTVILNPMIQSHRCVLVSNLCKYSWNKLSLYFVYS